MLGEAFMEPASELPLDRSRDSIPGWDSMGALALMPDWSRTSGTPALTGA